MHKSRQVFALFLRLVWYSRLAKGLKSRIGATEIIQDYTKEDNGGFIRL
jgi:hypothetical protein